MSRMRLQKFITAIASDWLARMSGPLTVPFTIAALFVSSADYRRLFAVLAILAVLVTCYRVWAREYDRAEIEIAKNEKPEIRGEVFDFKRRGVFGDSIVGKKCSCSFHLGFRMYLCNHRAVSTTVKEIKLDGSGMNPKLTFSEIILTEDVRLDRGIGKELAKGVLVGVEDKLLEDVQMVSTQGLKVFIIDAFGQTHDIPLRAGELCF